MPKGASGSLFEEAAALETSRRPDLFEEAAALEAPAPTLDTVREAADKLRRDLAREPEELPAPTTATPENVEQKLTIVRPQEAPVQPILFPTRDRLPPGQRPVTVASEEMATQIQAAKDRGEPMSTTQAAAGAVADVAKAVLDMGTGIAALPGVAYEAVRPKTDFDRARRIEEHRRLAAEMDAAIGRPAPIGGMIAPRKKPLPKPETGMVEDMTGGAVTRFARLFPGSPLESDLLGSFAVPGALPGEPTGMAAFAGSAGDILNDVATWVPVGVGALKGAARLGGAARAVAGKIPTSARWANVVFQDGVPLEVQRSVAGKLPTMPPPVPTVSTGGLRPGSLGIGTASREAAAVGASTRTAATTVRGALAPHGLGPPPITRVQGAVHTVVTPVLKASKTVSRPFDSAYKGYLDWWAKQTAAGYKGALSVHKALPQRAQEALHEVRIFAQTPQQYLPKDLVARLSERLGAKADLADVMLEANRLLPDLPVNLQEKVFLARVRPEEFAAYADITPDADEITALATKHRPYYDVLTALGEQLVDLGGMSEAVRAIRNPVYLRRLYASHAINSMRGFLHNDPTWTNLKPLAKVPKARKGGWFAALKWRVQTDPKAAILRSMWDVGNAIDSLRFYRAVAQTPEIALEAGSYFDALEDAALTGRALVAAENAGVREGGNLWDARKALETRRAELQSDFEAMQRRASVEATLTPEQKAARTVRDLARRSVRERVEKAESVTRGVERALARARVRVLREEQRLQAATERLRDALVERDTALPQLAAEARQAVRLTVEKRRGALAAAERQVVAAQARIATVRVGKQMAATAEREAQRIRGEITRLADVEAQAAERVSVVDVAIRERMRATFAETTARLKARVEDARMARADIEAAAADLPDTVARIMGTSAIDLGAADRQAALLQLDDTIRRAEKAAGVEALPTRAMTVQRTVAEHDQFIGAIDRFISASPWGAAMEPDAVWKELAARQATAQASIDGLPQKAAAHGAKFGREFVSLDEAIWRMKRSGSKDAPVIGKERADAMEQARSRKMFGALRGAWVDAAMAPDLLRFTMPIRQELSIFAEAMGVLKVAITAYFPPTHAGNMIGNVITADLGGYSIFRQTYMNDVARGMLLSKHSTVAAFRSLGLRLSSELDDEKFLALMQDIYPTTADSLLDGAAKQVRRVRLGLQRIPVLGQMERAYRFEDDSMRFGYAVDAVVNRGMTPVDAVRLANKWIIDSRIRAPATRKLDAVRWFLNWAYQAGQLVTESAVTNPLRLGVWAGLPYALTAGAYEVMTDDERRVAGAPGERESARPPWQRGVLLPSLLEESGLAWLATAVGAGALGGGALGMLGVRGASLAKAAASTARGAAVGGLAAATLEATLGIPQAGLVPDFEGRDLVSGLIGEEMAGPIGALAGAWASQTARDVSRETGKPVELRWSRVHPGAAVASGLRSPVNIPPLEWGRQLATGKTAFGTPVPGGAARRAIDALPTSAWVANLTDAINEERQDRGGALDARRFLLQSLLFAAPPQSMEDFNRQETLRIRGARQVGRYIERKFYPPDKRDMGRIRARVEKERER